MSQDKEKTTVNIKTGIFTFGFIICVLFTIVCIMMTSWVVVRMHEQQTENRQYRSMVDELLVRVERLEATVMELSGSSKMSSSSLRDDLLTIDAENSSDQSELSAKVVFDNSSYNDDVLPEMKSNNNVSGNPSDTEINIQDGSGTLYIRWGRTTCPTSAELVYEGIIGGEYYSHSGGGSNYQCLPLDPIWDRPSSGFTSYSARMFGTEYETRGFDELSYLDDYDAVCAVCLVNSRSRLLMIPARNECPSEEWTKEYHGYLMAQKYESERTEFICLDRNPEVRPGSVDSQQGALLHPVEAECGSRPCAPYIDGYELTCAVCTI